MTAVPAPQRYVARRAFTYGALDLARGQVFRLTGAPNDAKLEDLRYIGPLEDGAETYVCPDCGAEFVATINPPAAHGATHRVAQPMGLP